MEKLRRRADFLAAGKGLRIGTGAFVLQMRRRDDDRPARIGFTVSRKVGNAVERNRVRRRLRDVVRRAAADDIHPGHDYVLIAHPAAIGAPFGRLAEDFVGALRRFAEGRGQPPRPAGKRRTSAGRTAQSHARDEPSSARKDR